MSLSSKEQPLPDMPMLHVLAKNWWLILVKGICALVFGMLALGWPGVTMVTLVLLYGVYALSDGVCAIAAALTGGTPAPRWWLAVIGLVGIGAGIFTLLWPGITGIALLMFIASWAVVSGIFQIIGAVRLRDEIDDEWYLIASGVLSVLFGLLLVLRPEIGALSIVVVIGVFAVIYGFLQIFLALRLRQHNHPVQQPKSV